MTNKSPKVLLLENIHSTARDLFIQEGFDVEVLKGSISGSELLGKLKGVDILGIRSKTQLQADIFKEAKDLVCAGCFCVGTNQVDLDSAKHAGVAVFNAPFSNTRSVAEMVIGEIIMLARQLGTRNNEMHQAVWTKTSDHCFEVRAKTLGIVGYGNIGSQVSAMAEAIGMRVVFYDVVSKLILGNAKPHATLHDLLADSDFVTIHVPETQLTQDMIGAEEIKAMKKGACLINASRGTVVDLSALAEALKSGHAGGAAIDVFPVEPEKNTKDFKNVLAGLHNVILTPHIGGATEEAQGNIGQEVATSLIRYFKTGSTLRSVNFPHADLGTPEKVHRLLNVHDNVPGMLRDINTIVSAEGLNIQGQHLSTDSKIGYLVIDFDQALPVSALKKIQALPHSIRTRALD